MKKQRRKKIEIRVYIVMAILVLIVSISSFSYALWTTEHKQTGESSITTGCFDIELEEGDAISLYNTYPIPDNAGLGSKGYKFTVKNKCTIAAKYTVKINKRSEYGNVNYEDYIKTYVDGQNIRTLSSLGNEGTLLTGVLGPASSEGASDSQRTYNLKMWLSSNYDHMATASESVSNYTVKLSVEANQISKTSTNLAEKIMANNEIKTGTPVFTKGEPPSSGGASSTGSGLFKGEDDNGASYYFRGDKTLINNYVHFANNYWRIVRINGDGTIRLILEDKLPTNYAFNTSYNERKYAGFTFDNTPCTNNSPCWSTHTSSNGSFTNSHNGSNSTIKTQLENWYNSNLSGKDSKIAYGTYCNDTSYGSGTDDDDSSSTMNYGARERLVGTNKGNPTLICLDPKDKNNTMRTYGGVYKLKIGLLSADEMNYAGLSYSSPNATSNNYLYKTYVWWGLSPRSFDSSYASVFDGGYGDLYYRNVSYTYGVRPVINLTTDILTTSGDGSANTPYEVQ